MATEDDAAASRKKPEERDVEALLKDHQVDVSKSESKVWVWKVTPPVYKAWQTTFSKEEKDREAGSLGSVFVTIDLLQGTATVDGSIVQDPTMPREFTSLKKSKEEEKSSETDRQREIILEMPTDGSKPTADSYSLVQTDIPGPVYICSETRGGKVAVDGMVYQKYDAKPRFNPTRKYMIKSSGPKLKEYTGPDTNKPQLLIMAVNRNDKKIASKGQQNKKQKMDPEMLQEMLFQLFEKQPRYTFNELATLTFQPQDFLRKTLDQICVKVREGVKILYEIKAEYKTQEN